MKPEDAEKNCREIAEKIGYSYTYVRTYAMDLQSIKKINKNAEDSVSGPGYENKEDEYDGIGQVYLQVGSRGHKRTRHI